MSRPEPIAAQPTMTGPIRRKSRSTLPPDASGDMHIILEVTDAGQPPLTSLSPSGRQGRLRPCVSRRAQNVVVALGHVPRSANVATVPDQLHQIHRHADRTPHMSDVIADQTSTIVRGLPHRQRHAVLPLRFLLPIRLHHRPSNGSRRKSG